MTGLLPARMGKDGAAVLCGQPTCPCEIGRVMGAHLVVARSLVELRDPQGKPYDPPCYAQPRSVVKRVRHAMIAGTRPTLRPRVRAATPAWTRDRLVFLPQHPEVWVKCPRCGNQSTVRPLVT